MSSTDVNSSSCSPIQKIPYEILAEILEDVCCDTVHIGTGTSSPIWTLQDVCMGWQQILRSIPKLWRNFEVGFQDADSEIETIAQRVQECLEFSQNDPLSIVIHPLVNHDMVPLHTYINKAIAHHADRWMSISFDANFLGRLVEQTTFVKHGLSQLRKLSITDSTCFDYNIFNSATKLEEVKFISCKLNVSALDDDSTRHFPWVNVKKLSFTRCWLSAEIMVSILSQTISLEVLKLERTFVDESGLPSTPTNTLLPSLHTLHISKCNMEHFPDTCRFSVPSLTDFHLDTFDAMNAKGCPFWPSVAQANVKRLHLGSCDEHLALDFIASLPSVEELSLSDFDHAWDELFQTLIWISTTDNSEVFNVLPVLRKLEFSEYMLDEETSFAAYVRAIMRSRSKYTNTQYSAHPSLSIKCTAKAFHESEDESEGREGLSEALLTLNSLKDLGNEIGISFEIIADENPERPHFWGTTRF